VGGSARPRRRRAEKDPRPRRTEGARRLRARPRARTRKPTFFRSWVRTGFGTNNVDHCTRLCHASSVAALMEGVGSAAVSATFNECKNSEVIVVIGANPTENHPVAATFFKQAAKRGATLIVMDPRGQALKRHATHMLPFQARHRRRDAQRRPEHDRGREASRRAVRPDLRRRLQAVRREREGFHGRGDGADLRHRRRRAAHGGAQILRAPSRRASSGAWACRSTPTAPTMRAA